MKTILVGFVLLTTMMVSARRLVYHPIIEITTTPFPTTTTPKSPANLIEIGTFDGNSYFGDRVLRNWSESQSFCESQGLMLAKIDNEEQLQFLRDAVRTLVHHEWSWVGNTGEHEVNRNCRKFSLFNRNSRCPILAPYGRGYVRRDCFQRRFALCQSVDSDYSDSSEVAFTKYFKNKDETSESESTEENHGTSENSNTDQTTEDEIFRTLIKGVIWSVMDAIRKEFTSISEEVPTFSELSAESESNE
ncbi:unnamed protein product [Orchesella dallaii]|uniref:C-type lectin domain-containing protein n=1 Tax=Orchesella dallaii TaxID=48710 RepID=A0ABP1PIP5_9HEXA